MMSQEREGIHVRLVKERAAASYAAPTIPLSSLLYSDVPQQDFAS